MRTSSLWSALALATLAFSASGCAVTPEEPGETGAPALGSTSSAVEAAYAGAGTFGIDNSPATSGSVLASTGYLSVPVLTTAGVPWVGTDGTPLDVRRDVHLHALRDHRRALRR